jgi:hypothetical protein
VGFCVALFISGATSTEVTDGAGMAMVSAIFVGIPALIALGLLIWMTIALWKQPTMAAGWYADPVGEAPWRYWDGKAWTDHTAQQIIPAFGPAR